MASPFRGNDIEDCKLSTIATFILAKSKPLIKCQSFENLISDNGICSQVMMLSKGIKFSNKILTNKHTLNWFKKEQYIPSLVLDRKTRSDRKYKPESICKRTIIHAKKLLSEHKADQLDPDIERKLDNFMKNKIKRWVLRFPYLPIGLRPIDAILDLRL